MRGDVCANCVCFRKRELSEKQAQLAQARGMDMSLGTCRFMPEEVPKREDDWCFQHKKRSK